MTSMKDNGHSFVIRFWPEHREVRNAAVLWRGMVRHVPSGRHLYSENLEEIKAFIEDYLPNEEPDEPFSNGNGLPDEAIRDDIEPSENKRIECNPSGRRG